MRTAKNGDFRTFTSSKSASEAVALNHGEDHEPWMCTVQDDRLISLYIYILCVMYMYIIYIYIHTLYFRIFFQEGIFSIFPTCANPGTRTSMFPIPIPVDQWRKSAKQHIEQASNHQKGLR